MKMRYLATLTLCAIAALPIHAQSTAIVQENELAMVYYMPLTQIAITIEYEEVTMQPGMFFQYAERYLGTKDVVTEPQTLYHITAINANTRAIADKERTFKVVAQRGMDAQLLSLTEDGILCGYNIPPQQPMPMPFPPQMPPQEPAPVSVPLLEEQMLANSTAKMAEGTAKQIYRLRETRLNILSGDVEHAPADGQAMQLVMNELNQQEQQLTALFVGKKSVKHHHKTIYFTPSEDVQEVLCRFSRFAGVVAADDLSGEPIMLTLTGQKQTLLPADDTKKSKSQPSQIYYNLPGTADIQIVYGTMTVKNTFQIAQYGVAIPLALDLFTSNNTPHIYFNTQTGNISSIQK